MYVVLLLAPVIALASISATEAPKPNKELRAASYEGKWSGVVKCLYDPGLWPEDECDVKFTFDIYGNSIFVEQIIRNKNGKESKSTVYPGEFRFLRLATNAIAIAMRTGNDEDGTWVESWSFSMTLADPNHMIVHWTRIVNNVDMPVGKKGSKFSSVGMGDLVREGSMK